MARILRGCLALVLHLGLFASAHALDYPSRTVRIIVPYATGGSAEAQARALAEQLAKIWNKPVIIENKPGAGTTVGATTVATSEPDGYTLYLAGTSHTISPSLYKGLRYDAVTSFAPISRLSTSPFVVLVHPSLGVNTLEELLALARKRPGELNYATSGVGAGPHFSAELLAATTNISVRHVPFRGSAPAMTALLGQHVDFAIGDMSALSLVKEGNLKALAVTAARRVPLLPDVPTIAETLGKEFEVTNWSAILAPAGTSEEIVKFINTSIHEAIRSPEVRRSLELQGFEATPSTPSELRAHLASEVKKYGELVARIGLVQN